MEQKDNLDLPEPLCISDTAAAKMLGVSRTCGSTQTAGLQHGKAGATSNHTLWTTAISSSESCLAQDAWGDERQKLTSIGLTGG